MTELIGKPAGKKASVCARCLKRGKRGVELVWRKGCDDALGLEEATESFIARLIEEHGRSCRARDDGHGFWQCPGANGQENRFGHGRSINARTGAVHRQGGREGLVRGLAPPPGMCGGTSSFTRLSWRVSIAVLAEAWIRANFLRHHHR